MAILSGSRAAERADHQAVELVERLPNNVTLGGDKIRGNKTGETEAYPSGLSPALLSALTFAIRA